MEQFEIYLSEALKSDFFAGGLALGALGITAAYLRVVGARIYMFVMRRVRVSVTLDNRSHAYRHFHIWMEAEGILNHARDMRMTDSNRSRGTKGYGPAPGRHWFTHAGKLCRLDRSLNERSKIGGGYNQRPMETIGITVFLGSVDTVMGWIARGREIATNRDRIGPGLFLHKGDYWDNIGDIRGRNIDTVLVDDDRIDRLLVDMRWFYGAQDWYSQRGVPWRRGYLLYGPPGTGKSSVIRALASELHLDIASLDIGRTGLTDDGLREAMISTPRRALIAIEDIDAVFVKRKSGENRVGVSFSGLLNAIDGVASQEGRALIMTTNHRDQLDPALIRPGRADMHVELATINAGTAAKLFARFFPDHTDLRDQFRVALGDTNHVPSAVQGWLLANCNDPNAAAGAQGLLPGPVAVAAE